MIRAELEMAFAVAALSWVERELELTYPEIGIALSVDRKTIHRWRKARKCSGHRSSFSRYRTPATGDSVEVIADRARRLHDSSWRHPPTPLRAS